MLSGSPPSGRRVFAPDLPRMGPCLLFPPLFASAWFLFGYAAPWAAVTPSRRPHTSSPATPSLLLATLFSLGPPGLYDDANIPLFNFFPHVSQLLRKFLTTLWLRNTTPLLFFRLIFPHGLRMLLSSTCSLGSVFFVYPPVRA